MKPLAVERPFPARISRSLTFALGVILVVVMLVGGTSLTLALRIHGSVADSAQAFGEILKLDQVHSIFDDLIFELHQIDSTRHLDGIGDAVLKQEETARRLDALDATIRAQAGAGEREQAIVAELRQFSEEGRAVTTRLAATGHLAGPDLEWLNRATHEVPRLTEELARPHELRIASLHENSQYLIQIIVVLFAAFTVVGVALVAVASFVVRRGISAPLRRLAVAAQGIAEGRLETRVPVRQANEIGLLAQTFNNMADQLQAHDSEMRRARGALEEKVREVRALYQIGTEIARLHQLDRVLQSVVDKARELLRGDAAALCLVTPEGGDRVAPARSGPLEAFRVGGADPPCEPPGSADGWGVLGPISPEYLRGQLAVPIHLGGGPLGTIQVGTREQRAFNTEEAELLSGLATQAAIAIERVRLSEEVRSLAAMQERERLAREMHDGLAQGLGLLHLKLCSALERSVDAPGIAESMREMVILTDQVYEEVRQSIFGLRTFVSRGLGLVPTLTEFLHEFSAQNGIDVELDVARGTFARLAPACEIQLVRIIQEALSNVRKHARTDHARVRLQRDGTWIVVTIEDDGMGWDPRTVPDRLHFGLRGMRERAEGLGGRLQIDTVPGQGTRVVATLPAGGP